MMKVGVTLNGLKIKFGGKSNEKNLELFRHVVIEQCFDDDGKEIDLKRRNKSCRNI